MTTKFKCPCCETEFEINEAQAAGKEPVDCPEPACGFNQLLPTSPAPVGDAE